MAAGGLAAADAAEAAAYAENDRLQRELEAEIQRQRNEALNSERARQPESGAQQSRTAAPMAARARDVRLRAVSGRPGEGESRRLHDVGALEGWTQEEIWQANAAYQSRYEPTKNYQDEPQKESRYEPQYHGQNEEAAPAGPSLYDAVYLQTKEMRSNGAADDDHLQIFAGIRAEDFNRYIQWLGKGTEFSKYKGSRAGIVSMIDSWHRNLDFKDFKKVISAALERDIILQSDYSLWRKA